MIVVLQLRISSYRYFVCLFVFRVCCNVQFRLSPDQYQALAGVGRGSEDVCTVPLSPVTRIASGHTTPLPVLPLATQACAQPPSVRQWRPGLEGGGGHETVTRHKSRCHVTSHRDSGQTVTRNILRIRKGQDGFSWCPHVNTRLRWQWCNYKCNKISHKWI